MKSLRVLIIVLLTVGLFTPALANPTLPQPMGITRSGVWLQQATEASWFVWSGELYYVYTDRDLSGSTKQMKVVKFSDNSVISTFGSGYGCQDVIVDSGTLYVFATSCWMDNSHRANSIVKFSSTNLTTWSGPTTVKTADAAQQYYNVSVVKNGSTYVIAYEFLKPDWYAGFTNEFISSTDLSSWSSTGGTLTGNYACPDLVYAGSNYFLFLGATLSSPTNYRTWMAKSSALSSFTFSRITVLRPTAEFEDINTTDTDAIEFDGKVYILYMVGDQSTYMRLTYATYDGTMAQFIDAYQQPGGL